MRYLRIVALCAFAISVGFFTWVNLHYYSNINTDIPTIISDTEDLIISTSEGTESLLKGLKAQDATDGDLTSQIMVSSISHFVEPKTVNVKYVVFDSSNNSASFTRKVRFSDYKSPQFSLTAPLTLIQGDDFNVLDYVKVTDCIDGDITEKIRVVSNEVSTYSAGVYPVTLEISNSYRDSAEITLWVTVLSEESNVAIELSKYIVYVNSGSNFDPTRYIRSITDAQGTDLPKDAVHLRSNLDLNTPGTYRVEYHYNDEQNQGQTALMVVVQSKEGAS